MIHTVFPHGTVEISGLKNGQIFKINGQRLKPFLATESESDEERVMGLFDPIYND